MQIPDNLTLYCVANRELGQNFRLTTDPNSQLEDFGMFPFGADVLQDCPAYIGLINDLILAQWWFIGKGIFGEVCKDGGFWITNVYSRKMRPNGEFLSWWLVTINDMDKADNPLNSPAYMKPGTIKSWQIAFQKITDEG